MAYECARPAENRQVWVRLPSPPPRSSSRRLTAEDAGLPPGNGGSTPSRLGHTPRARRPTGGHRSCKPEMRVRFPSRSTNLDTGSSFNSGLRTLGREFACASVTAVLIDHSGHETGTLRNPKKDTDARRRRRGCKSRRAHRSRIQERDAVRIRAAAIVRLSRRSQRATFPTSRPDIQAQFRLI